MINIILNSTGVTIPGLKKDLPKSKKIAHTDIGNSWQKKVLPGHFTMSAYKKYDYADRQGMNEEWIRQKVQEFFRERLAHFKSRRRKAPFISYATAERRVIRRSYVGRKRSVRHHNLPLVWSGFSRNAALSRNVRATSSLTRVVIKAPALNFRKPGAPNMREEVTRVIPSEEKVIEKEFLASVERELKKSKPEQRTRKIRG